MIDVIHQFVECDKTDLSLAYSGELTWQQKKLASQICPEKNIIIQ